MSIVNRLLIKSAEVTLPELVTEIKHRAHAKFPADVIAAKHHNQRMELAAGYIHRYWCGCDPKPPLLSELIRMDSDAVANAAKEPEIAHIVKNLLDEVRAIDKEMSSFLQCASSALSGDSPDVGTVQGAPKPLRWPGYRISITSDGDLIIESAPSGSAMVMRKSSGAHGSDFAHQ